MEVTTLLENPNIRAVYNKLKESDGVKIAENYLKVELNAWVKTNERLSRVETERLKYFLKDEDKRHKNMVRKTRGYKEIYGTVRALFVR
jgi:hypothetical protein